MSFVIFVLHRNCARTPKSLARAHKACSPSSISFCRQEGGLPDNKAVRPDSASPLSAATAAATITDHTIMAGTAILESVRRTIAVIASEGATRAAEIAGGGAAPAIVSGVASPTAVATLRAHWITQVVPRAHAITDIALLGVRNAGRAHAQGRQHHQNAERTQRKAKCRCLAWVASVTEYLRDPDTTSLQHIRSPPKFSPNDAILAVNSARRHAHVGNSRRSRR
jgi:hypothetical protein